MNRTFKCESCGKTIEIDDNWSEADALNEKQDNFGNMPIEDCSKVCTECFNRIMAFNNHLPIAK